MVKSILAVLWVAATGAPGTPAIVSTEPMRISGSDKVRIQVLTSASRPPEEQLVLEGGTQLKGSKSPSGRLAYSVLEKIVSVSDDGLLLMHIGRDKILLAIKPESVITVRYDDCASWYLESPLTVTADYCERNERLCRRGYVESGESAHPDDDICKGLNAPANALVKFCIREGQFRVRARPGTQFGIERENASKTTQTVPQSGLTEYMPAVYQRCGRVEITTMSDRAVIAIGSNQRWTIDVAADGRIIGGVREKNR